MKHTVLLISVALASMSYAQAESCLKGTCDHGCCEAECPCCQYFCKHVCKLTKETEDEKKHCWNVQCKPICIPKIRFPWEKCCQPKGATLKYVHVLKKHEYKCPSCKYVWTPVCKECNSCDDCQSNVHPSKQEELPKSPAHHLSKWFDASTGPFKR